VSEGGRAEGAMTGEERKEKKKLKKKQISDLKIFFFFLGWALACANFWRGWGFKLEGWAEVFN
jgi:hypothetical protein